MTENVTPTFVSPPPRKDVCPFPPLTQAINAMLAGHPLHTRLQIIHFCAHSVEAITVYIQCDTKSEPCKYVVFVNSLNVGPVEPTM